MCMCICYSTQKLKAYVIRTFVPQHSKCTFECCEWCYYRFVTYLILHWHTECCHTLCYVSALVANMTVRVMCVQWVQAMWWTLQKVTLTPTNGSSLTARPAISKTSLINLNGTRWVHNVVIMSIYAGYSNMFVYYNLIIAITNISINTHKIKLQIGNCETCYCCGSRGIIIMVLIM